MDIYEKLDAVSKPALKQSSKNTQRINKRNIRFICAYCTGDTVAPDELTGELLENPDTTKPAIIVNPNPCKDCQAIMSRGITIILVSPQPIHPLQPVANIRGMKEPMYHTGDWVVIDPNHLRLYFDDDSLVKQALKDGRIFTDNAKAMDIIINDIRRHIEQSKKN